ncbi:MAG: hypothetical protein ABFE07_21080 [Armatimonadia bacterium]
MMRHLTIAMAGVMLLALVGAAMAEEAAPQVLVGDRGLQDRTIGPGAPAHTVGLKGVEHLMTLDTGARQFGLRYVVARDPKDEAAAIPGEGYIGMPEPTAANWYHGGFFQLVINGEDIGRTFAHSVTGRSLGNRGYVDFVFDTRQAVVRVRFVGKAGDDALYCQALLEPKQEIKSLKLVLRCYPSAFISDGERHVMTPVRDLKQGEKAELDLANEEWLLYYDSLYDAGYTSAHGTAAGPCSALFPGSQASKCGFTVASYGIDTVFELKPMLRDFRFVFFDYAGTKNAEAQADLRRRAQGLLQELVTFQFTDPSLAGWDLQQKQEEVRKALALVPDDKEAAAKYQGWGEQLAAQLDLIKTGKAGAIMGEAEAATIIGEWERGLPELKLKALLNEI